MKRHIILCFAFAILCSFAYGDDYYIAPDGNDANPGTLERPLATIEQSQKLWRNAPAAKEIRVFYRGGCYEFVNTVTFDDSDRKVPITIAAYKNEKPLLQGSQKIDGWKPSQRFPGAIETQLTKRQLDAFPLPGQLFSDGKRLVRARHPDRDESNPRQKGFLFVKGTFVPPFEYPGRLIGSLVMPPVPGTSITWNFDGVVVPGEYRVWFRYATNTKLRQLPHGQTNFDGRWSLQVNNGRPIKMQNLPDTNTPEIVHAHGGWANCATVTLRKGENTITWINDAGDLVGFGGMALAIDPEWKPAKDMKIRQFPMTDDKPIIHLAASNFNSSYIKKSKWTISVYIGTKDAFRFVPGNLKENWCGPEVEMHIFPGGLGSCHAYMEIAQVDKIDSRQNIVWLADLPWKKTISEADVNNAGAIANGHETDLVSPFEIGARYYLENHPDFLNAKGEWYLDRKSGIVYLYPLDGNKTDIRMDNTATLFRVLGKNGNSSPTLTLRGLTITETAHTRDDGHIGYQTGTRGVIEM
ncbi:MAG: hypothetical protein PHQ75_09200, partial [Thermoguttaceae bacterium]|nr:hypothetical protein [Thermoguttaceae bacterium]